MMNCWKCKLCIFIMTTNKKTIQLPMQVYFWMKKTTERNVNETTSEWNAWSLFQEAKVIEKEVLGWQLLRFLDLVGLKSCSIWSSGSVRDSLFVHENGRRCFVKLWPAFSDPATTHIVLLPRPEILIFWVGRAEELFDLVVWLRQG